MRGYRNMSLVILACATSTWLAYTGITHGTDLVGLATIIGAKDVAIMGMIFGRGYNKAALNGKKPLDTKPPPQ